jgi:hypothetical protein|tara:strand:- start:2370 stop:2492 length:123 start_codon:yes stop_codon:yes gene_type:complete
MIKRHFVAFLLSLSIQFFANGAATVLHSGMHIEEPLSLHL